MTTQNLITGKAQLEWHVPEDIVRRYANNLLVQAGDHEVILSFFETTPPVLVGSPEEIEQKVKEIKSVRSRCVASVIVSIEKMPVFLEAMQGMYDRLIARKASQLADTAITPKTGELSINKP